MKNTLVVLVVLLLAGGVVYFLTKDDQTVVPVVPEHVTQTTESNEATTSVKDVSIINEPEIEKPSEVIGASVGEHDITAYHYGSGEKEVLFVGGIHGGYSWNTVLVAYELMDYLEANPDVIPEHVRVTVIPVLNPDGLDAVVGTTGRFAKADAPTALNRTTPGRFNGNNVDLNRNFDCDWQPEGTWQNKTVSGGSKAFSEPESQAFKTYIEEHVPTAVVVWYGAAGGVFSSNCHTGVLSETATLTNLYANASGYTAYESFDFYEVTGDMVNWLAKMKIPAMSVLLTTREDTEWNKNKAGIEALLSHYAQ